MSTSQAPRPRRIEDALSSLVDSLLPPLPIPDDISSDGEEAIAEAEEQRHDEYLERAWRVLDSHTNSANDPVSLSSTAENINNASDLIKRKLLRENASPDKAVRFSNLYSRLLTQPVLSQKWAILYLLYQLSNSDDGDDDVVDDGGGGGRSRSPLLEEVNLQNMLFKGQRARRVTGPRLGENSDDEGPAISSSASQVRPVRANRSSSLRLDREREKERESDKDLARPSSQRAGEKRWSTSLVAEGGAKEKPVPVEEQRKSAAAEKSEKPAEPPEQALLRDLPYNLQGISSTNLKFSSSSVLTFPPTIPIPIISLLHTLAEPCLLYKGLSSFVETSDGGLVIQSLRAAIANELRSYLGLVATLEGEIRRALAAIGESDEPKSMLKGGVTLRRCVVWTRDATMALRLMSLIVEESHSKLLLWKRVCCLALNIMMLQVKRAAS